MTDDVRAARPDFNRIAPLYRWLEYLALGRVLERARLAHLAKLPRRGQALVLGDGDGRFTARLLASRPELQACAVDLSDAMLRLLTRHVGSLDPDALRRLATCHADARTYLPERRCDLVVTHFFLDCLTEDEVRALVARLSATGLEPGAYWLITEFRVPPGALAVAARMYIRALYLAFRVLTGLRVTRLPAYGRALQAAGFQRIAVRYGLLGMLVSELWQRTGSTRGGRDDLH